jgi:DNA-binding XRE family transcriptional regulator
MDDYLYGLGLHMSSIRSELAWTQEDLGQKIGISRLTIGNIEKNPKKMGKTVAISLFFVVKLEILRQQRIAKKIEEQNLLVDINALEEISPIIKEMLESIEIRTELITKHYIRSTWYNPFTWGNEVEVAEVTEKITLNEAIKRAVEERWGKINQYFGLNSLDDDDFYKLLTKSGNIKNPDSSSSEMK